MSTEAVVVLVEALDQFVILACSVWLSTSLFRTFMWRGKQ